MVPKAEAIQPPEEAVLLAEAALLEGAVLPAEVVLPAEAVRRGPTAHPPEIHQRKNAESVERNVL